MNLANYTGWTLDYITKRISVKALMLLIESLPDRDEPTEGWHRPHAKGGPVTETDLVMTGMDTILTYEKKEVT